MATLTLEATEVKEYRSGELRTDGTIRMGTQMHGTNYTQAWYHDVVIALDLPKSLEMLTVTQEWRTHQEGSTSYVFSAALTQEERTTAPSEADLTYKFPRDNIATITFEKKLKKGRWYLWLWRHDKSKPSFMYGGRGTYPKLEITGETAGGVVKVAVGGEVKDTVPKVYKNGGWEDIMPRVYKNGTWEEMS